MSPNQRERERERESYPGETEATEESKNIFWKEWTFSDVRKDIKSMQKRINAIREQQTRKTLRNSKYYSI